MGISITEADCTVLLPRILAKMFLSEKGIVESCSWRCPIDQRRLSQGWFAA
jgi:hypothetical protein